VFDAEKPEFVIMYGLGMRNCVKHYTLVSVMPTISQHSVPRNYEPLLSFVVHARLSTWLPWFKVDDNSWNEIMAMATRMRS
jgi:hypothetical protein